MRYLATAVAMVFLLLPMAAVAGPLGQVTPNPPRPADGSSPAILSAIIAGSSHISLGAD